jgi:hypothetical protein
MLLNINTKPRLADRKRTLRLQSIGIKEGALQSILHDDEMNLGNVISPLARITFVRNPVAQTAECDISR